MLLTVLELLGNLTVIFTFCMLW